MRPTINLAGTNKVSLALASQVVGCRGISAAILDESVPFLVPFSFHAIDNMRLIEKGSTVSPEHSYAVKIL